jgi:hypothetical protein
MPTLIKNKILWVCVMLFLFHQLSQKLLHWDWPFFDSYLDPFLCMPLVFSLFLLERQWLWGITARLTIMDTFLFTILLTILFEWVFPLLHSGFTADFYDLIAYGLGSMCFYFFINPKPRLCQKESSNH